jgi:calcineurin-like phosphoesterase family protein
MRTFFTADTHFGHAAILRMCERPFDTIDEHDRALIDNWNRVVGKDDRVFFLGDFVYRAAPNLARRIFDQLNGKEKHLIIGNHDTKGDPVSRPTSTEQLPWTSQSHYAETVIDGQRLCMFHYGMRVWPGMHHGSVQLYGHSHGRLPGTARSIDVGVDVFGYTPVTWPEIRARLATMPPLELVPDTDAVEGLAVAPEGDLVDLDE